MSDVSKWVRSAVFQQLGPFLATLPQKEITPQLLKHYTGMIAPSSSNGNEPADDELRLFCAFSFPAVALTLGRDRYCCHHSLFPLQLLLLMICRWSELRDTFSALARDVQWQVRRTLSFSLHEVAKVLGSELAEKELLATFGLFLHDLDEVCCTTCSDRETPLNYFVLLNC